MGSAELERIRGLAAEALGLVVPHDLDDAAVGQAVDGVQSLLQSSCALLLDLTHVEGPPALADFAAFAHGAQRRSLSSLGPHTPRTDRLALIGHVVREVLDSLVAADRLLAGHLGVPEGPVQTQDLLRLRAVRHACATFRADLAGDPGPDLFVELRRTNASLVKLIGRDAFVHLRMLDRLLLVDLADRLRAWLSLGRTDDGGHVLAGQRLRQELRNVSELLLDVQHRPDLCDFDREEMQAIDAALAAGARIGALLPRLRNLRGRSDRLDALEPTTPDSEARAALAEALRGLPWSRGPAPRATTARVRPAPELVDWSSL